MVGVVKLPSAEEHKEALYALYTDADGEPCWPETPQLLEWSRSYADARLEEAAEVVEGRIEAYIDAVPNAMKKTIDLRNAVLADAAAAIRKLYELQMKEDD